MNLSEWLVIVLVAIAVFSPKHLPELARLLSRGMRIIQSLSHELKQSLEQSIAEEELHANEERARQADKHYQ